MVDEDQRPVNISINIHVGVDPKGKPVMDSQEIASLVHGASLPQLVQSTNRPSLAKQASVPKLLSVSSTDSYKSAEHSITPNDVDDAFMRVKGNFELTSWHTYGEAGCTCGELADAFWGSCQAIEQQEAENKKQEIQEKVAAYSEELGCAVIEWQRVAAATSILGREAGRFERHDGPRWLRVHKVFEKFCEGQDGLNGEQFSRLAVECGIVDSKCMKGDVEVIFAQVVLKGERSEQTLPLIVKKTERTLRIAAQHIRCVGAHTITFNQFMNCLDKIATKRGQSSAGFQQRLLDHSPAPDSSFSFSLHDLKASTVDEPAEPVTDSESLPSFRLLVSNSSEEALAPATASTPVPPRKKPKSSSPKSSQELWCALEKRKRAAVAGAVRKSL
eukprot:2222423-Rhodomonas_salina.1